MFSNGYSQTFLVEGMLMRGICALCKKDEDLQNSHLLAASFFKSVSKGFSPPTNAPIVVDGIGGSMYYSNTQPTKHLLCSSCEQRFSSLGENYVTSTCHRKGGKFELRDTLAALQPSDFHSGGLATFNADAVSPTIDVEAYSYFALSVLWRGSVADWGSRYNRYTGALGRYEEAFRKYLLGEDGFPMNTCIQVHFDIEDHTKIGLSPPVMEKMNVLDNVNCRVHYFSIPGIFFYVMIGGETSAYLRKISRRTLSKTFFFAIRFSSMPIAHRAAKLATMTIPKGKLAAEMSKGMK